MKTVKTKMLKMCIALLPIMIFAVSINANTIASPFNRQPVLPDILKNTENSDMFHFDENISFVPKDCNFYGSMLKYL